MLPPYHTNLTNRLVKAPKLYFLDTGLCAYLTGWSTATTLEAGAMSGAMLETWVISEILKSYWHNGKQAPLYYYRDRDKKEIDLLIAQDDVIYPLEIKKTANPSQRTVQDFKILTHLDKTIGEGAIICLTDAWLPMTKNTSAIPVGFI